MLAAPSLAGGCETAKPAADEVSLLAGSSGSSTPRPGAVRRLEANAPAAADPTAGLMDPGAEVDGNVGKERVSRRAREAAVRPGTTTQSTPGGGAGAPGSPGSPATPGSTGAPGTGGKAASAPGRGSSPDEQRPEWAVLLASFTEENHRATAESARAAIVERFPALKGAYVRSMGSGSAVLIGRFSGPQDPEAQAELKRVKEIGEGTPKPFVRAMLTRVTTAAQAGPIGPHDLRSVRQRQPRGTLYTLQVAAWATLGSREMTMSQVKRSAEGYAQQLRAQGYEAYYFHDFGQETSTVTIGVFGPDSYDSRSTLYSPEVEALMRSFPKSLLNGEEVLVEADPRRPGTKRIPQASRLVEIPKF
jgi:hypothetical protein